MRKSFLSNPYENNNGEMSFSQQSNIMPNFLTGTNMVSESSPFNQSNFSTNSIQSLSQFDPKIGRNIRHQELAQDATKRNGPPISNMWNKSPRSSFLRTRPLNEDSNVSISSRSTSVFNQSNGGMNQSSNIRDSDSYNKFVQLKGENKNEDGFENWVTVFGYTPEQAQHILMYFSELGPITKQIISNRGNWMHLQYESKMHAVAALNKNGRIINSLAMIGVKPCDDKSAEVPCMMNSSRISNLNCSVGNINGTLNNHDGYSKSPVEKRDALNMSVSNGGMRSLTHRESSNLVNLDGPIPRKGMLNRAMSLIWRK